MTVTATASATTPHDFFVCLTTTLRLALESGALQTTLLAHVVDAFSDFFAP